MKKKRAYIYNIEGKRVLVSAELKADLELARRLRETAFSYHSTKKRQAKFKTAPAKKKKKRKDAWFFKVAQSRN